MKLLEAEKLVLQLLDKHNLLANCWKFGWIKNSRAFGICNYTKKTIFLSMELVQLNNESEVTDTILHEIAHANTPGDGHGNKWKKECVALGCRPIARFNEEMAVTINNKFEAKCGNCQKTYKNKLPIPLRCSCNQFSATKTLLNWNQRQITVSND